MGRAPHCSSSSRNDKNGLKKGPWTQEEDQMLIDYIQKHGSGNWRNLPKKAGLERCGKSCRLRWTNYLRPDIKRGRFTFEEEDAIIQLHSILGNKWSAIAGHLPGRTDNEIKNFWNTRIRKRLLKMGIDPVTHRPQLNLVRHQLSSIVNSYLYNNPSPPAADQIVMNNNMSRFLGLENNHHQQHHPCGSFLNPEMLERATSLLLSSSQHRQQNSPSDFHMPQHNEEILPPHQLFNNNDIAQIQSQPQFGALPPLIQTCSPTLEEEPPFPASAASPCFPYSSSEQPQLFDHSSSGTYPLNISDFDVQFLCDIVPNCTAAAGSEDGRERQIHDTDTALPSEFQNYNPAGSDPRDHTNLLDTWSENSTIDRSCRQDFFTSPPSVFSTSSSSPTPLNSTTTNATTDDERESYCSSIFRFDSPHIFEGFII